MIDALRQQYPGAYLVLFVRGVLALACGIFILAYPFGSLGPLAVLISVVALASGVAEIAYGLQTRTLFMFWWILCVGGLLSMCLGLIAVYEYPDLSLVFLLAWIALSLAMIGVVVMFSSVQMKKAGIPWAGSFMWGLFSIVASVMVVTHPYGLVSLMLAALVIFSVICGTVLLIAAWRIGSFTKRLAAILVPLSEWRRWSLKPIASRNEIWRR